MAISDSSKNPNTPSGDKKESSEQRYQELFEDSPVAIWVDDWSLVKQMLDAMEGIDDWRSYFSQNPDKLRKAYDATKIVQVSNAAVKLFNEESIDTLLQHSLAEEVIDEELESFLVLLIDFWNHKFNRTIETKDVDGERNEIIIRQQSIIPPAHQKNWSRIIYALEDITERVRLEEQLRQAQKMEMVGQLTGGVAHDFNNILAVIQGNAQLLSEGIGDANENIAAILDASNRATALTHRLLIFSRRQNLEPSALDLKTLIENMSDLLARSLGETIDITYNIITDPWIVFADASQLENALLNLAINSRDAMPEGGLITIECSNVYLDTDYIAAEHARTGYINSYSDTNTLNSDFQPGNYVALTVSDSGQGMAEEVLSQIFEPFFTTKALGAGTGLGLAMVYSFIKQSGGHITVSSTLDRGTQSTLYLRKVDNSAVDSPEKDNRLENRVSKQLQILLLEDDKHVRKLVTKMLRELGHVVVAVSRVSEAETALAQGTAFEFLLSDVVLRGGSNGPDFANQALAQYPDLKCIFMSGYSPKHSQSSIKDLKWELLQKPFSMQQLDNALQNAPN